MAAIHHGRARHCRLAGIASSFLLAFVLTACGGGGSSEPPPVAAYAQVQAPVRADIAKAVKFTAKVNNPSNLTVQYLWEFGDGQTSTQAEPEHQYAAAGDFTVTLTLSTTAGKTTQSSKVQIGYFAGLDGFPCSGNEAMLGWCKQSYLPTMQSLYGVKMVSAKAGWAVGNNRTVLRTLDGGLTWSTGSAPGTSSTWLQGISALDENTAWVVGSSGFIAKTADGGKTWQMQVTGISETLTSITVVDGNTLWASGGNAVLRSVDGGATWTKLTVTTSGYNYLSGGISAPSANVAWIATYSGVYRTEDGGVSWKSVSAGNYPYGLSIWAFDNKTAWLIDSSNNVKRTADGGATWLNVSISVPGRAYFYGGHRQILALSPNNLYIVESSGFVIRSQDGGATWAEMPQLESCNSCGKTFAAMSIADPDNAIVVGDYGTVFVMQAGKPWTRINRGILNFGYGSTSPIAALNADEAFIPISSQLYGTNDGGRNWEAKVAVCVRELRKIGTASLIGIGCSGSSFLKSADKGKTWTTLIIGGQTFGPSKIAVVSETVVWALGASYDSSTGRVAYRAARSNDGGVTWEISPAIANTGLSVIAAADEKTAWVGGDNGVIYMTADGGKTWTLQASGAVGSSITSIVAYNTITAWATSSTKSVLGTKDGGATWVVQDTSASNVMYAVATLDGKVVWAVGAKGRILRSTDGGATWSEQVSGVTEDLRSITLIDNNTAWVAGDFSTILKTATGGK